MAKVKARQRPFKIGEVEVPAGKRVTVDLPIARLATHTPMTMPVQVVHGKYHGPCLFVSATIHGDEINGIEIIRRVLKYHALKRLRGTLLCVPVVNAYGFLAHTRYLPDRRDLNRSFPGSTKGSLASRLANAFMTHIVAKATHGIDLHTGAIHRSNLPQIRARLDDPETKQLACAFGAPVAINSTLRDGSLRQAAAEKNIPMLLYEGGEALRFDEVSIRAGVRGVIRVMDNLKMIRSHHGARRTGKPSTRTIPKPTLVRATTWVRAPSSGVLRIVAPLGAHVKDGETLAIVSDPFGDNEMPVEATTTGVVIGRNNLPLVSEGDALFHLAAVEAAKKVTAAIETLQTPLESEAETEDLFEPPIV